MNVGKAYKKKCSYHGWVDCCMIMSSWRKWDETGKKIFHAKVIRIIENSNLNDYKLFEKENSIKTTL